jgi:hypothetical protein
VAGGRRHQATGRERSYAFQGLLASGLHRHWGHIAEGDYRIEWERLVARREELVATEGVAVNTAALPLGSLTKPPVIFL